MLISSCWQLSSEVELRRIFDVCKRWANSGSHEFVKKIWFDTWGHTGDSLTACVKMQHFYTCSAPTARFGLLYRNILFFFSYKNQKLKKKKPQKLNELYLTLVYVKANAFRNIQSGAKSSATLDGFRAGLCTAREKNSFFILANNLNPILFSAHSELRVYNTCVLNFSLASRVERMKISISS